MTDPSLLSAKDGGQLWFQSYECEIRDVFEIQDEITAAIIGALAKSIIVQRGAPYGRSALFDR